MFEGDYSIYLFADVDSYRETRANVENMVQYNTKLINAIMVTVRH